MYPCLQGCLQQTRALLVLTFAQSWDAGGMHFHTPKPIDLGSSSLDLGECCAEGHSHVALGTDPGLDHSLRLTTRLENYSMQMVASGWVSKQAGSPG